MLKTIREEKGLVYSIRASSDAAVVYPGFGRFVAVAPTDPGKAPALATAVEEMYATFAKDGPTEEELTVAKKQTATLLDENVAFFQIGLMRDTSEVPETIIIDHMIEATTLKEVTP